MSGYCVPRMDPLNLEGLAHGSTWQNTIGVQYIPVEALPVNLFREVPLQAMRTVSRTRDPINSPNSKWWTVNISGSTLTRDIPALSAGTQEVAGWSEMLSSGVPTSPLYAKLKWDATEVIVSVGAGVRVSVLVPNITVSLLVPAQDAVENRNDRNARIGVVTSGPLFTTVIDTLASISVTSSEAPTGTHDARLSMSYAQNNTDIDVVTIDGIATGSGVGLYKIPARARRVQFSVNGVGAPPPIPGASGPEFLDNVVDRNVLADINHWPNDAAGNPRTYSNIVDVPQNASVVRFQSNDLPNIIHATWELEL